jgi:hypothetical protein
MLTITKSSFIPSFYSSFWFPLIAVLARLNSSTAEISFFIIAGYALFGKRQVIQALALLFFFTMINFEIAPAVELVSLFRYVVIFFAFLSIFFRVSFLKYDPLTLYTLGLAVFITIHSIFFSKLADLSILKIVNWIVVVITLFKAWTGLNELEHDRMKKWITRFFLLVALSSLPFLLIPEVGYSINSYGFQGVLSHPQTFGIFIALVTSIFFGYLFEKNKYSWLLFGIFFLLLCLIFFSESRTAAFSLIIALVLSFSFFFILNFFLRKKNKIIFKNFFIFILLLFSIILLLSSLEINYLIGYFLTKSDRANFDSLLQIYLESREGLLQPMIENIKKDFMTGIGFGLASDPLMMNIQRDPFFNLPIAAPTEKGIIFISILEELGIFGFILFVIWIFILFYKAIINGIYSTIVLIVILSSNIGEATLFSTGGVGLLFLILLTQITTRPKLSSFSSASWYTKN